ncbi:hypothetical protein M9H77_22326 [Catharanthus roseus]|uniref:Uncharacterized protein n=1 Tax=Catharanthus roseus TaxID=4058 RepID=A0ACC0ASR6_CATRO|nr:hypothetical protein M9H77_22326 [Catharanthus roseus]
MSIAHRKIQKSSSSGSGSVSRSGLGFSSSSGFCERGRLPQAPRGRGRGRSRRQSSLSSVINPSPCSTLPCTDVFPSFIYLFIENWKNMIGDGNCGYRIVADFVLGDEHQWPELQMHDGCPIPPLHVQ